MFRGIGGASYSDGSLPEKSFFNKVIDYLYLFFVKKTVPANYHIFQFDVKPRNEFNEYLDEPSSWFVRQKFYQYLWDDAYSCLVNDKYLFHCMCCVHKLPVPRLIGTFESGVLREFEGEPTTAVTGQGFEEVIIKPVEGMQGKGIIFAGLDAERRRVVPSRRQVNPVSQVPEKGTFIVQELLKQHQDLQRLNPYSVNTVRMITLLTSSGNVEFLTAMLRTSADESAIDNFTSGGIVIGIDLATGALKERGLRKAPFGTTLTSHPVTGVEFGGFVVPHWAEVLRVADRAQKVFHRLKAIGWDLAITEQGPVLIEGNIEWGTAGIQAANGGLLTPRVRGHLAEYGLFFHGWR